MRFTQLLIVSLWAASSALVAQVAPEEGGQSRDRNRPEPNPAPVYDQQERIQAILDKLDGDDATTDGEGVKGWTIADLPKVAQEPFRKLTDADRAVYYSLPLEEARLAVQEGAIAPPDLLGFEMKADFVKQGARIVGLHVRGKSKGGPHMKVFLCMRFPDPTKPGALLSWKTHLSSDGTFDSRYNLGTKKMHYGHYFVTGIADPQSLSNASDYIEREVTDAKGRRVPVYFRGLEQRVLSYGTPEQLAAEEVQLKRFYVQILEQNLLPLHVELHTNYDLFQKGERGVREVLTSGPGLTPGPVAEETITVFDPAEWRAFLDDDVYPFLAENREVLRRARSQYLAPRFPEILSNLEVAVRDLAELTRRKSIALYRHWNLPIDPRDTPAIYDTMLEPGMWQKRFDTVVSSLHRNGIDEISVRALEESFKVMGWSLPPSDDSAPVRRRATDR